MVGLRLGNARVRSQMGAGVLKQYRPPMVPPHRIAHAVQGRDTRADRFAGRRNTRRMTDLRYIAGALLSIVAISASAAVQAQSAQMSSSGAAAQGPGRPATAVPQATPVGQRPMDPFVVPHVELFDARATTVRFGCDAPAGNLCYFHVQSALRNIAQRFAVPPGQKVIVTGVAVGLDRYIVTVNQVPPLLLDCRAVADPKKFCKVAAVQKEYNN